MQYGTDRKSAPKNWFFLKKKEKTHVRGKWISWILYNFIEKIKNTSKIVVYVNGN